MEEAVVTEVEVQTAVAVEVEPATGLFCATANANRLAFAIDISGSMAKPCAGGVRPQAQCHEIVSQAKVPRCLSSI